MTLEEFVASRRFCRDLYEELEVEPVEEGAVPVGFVYDDQWYIEIVTEEFEDIENIDGAFRTQILNTEFFSSNLQDVEEWLYNGVMKWFNEE